MKAGKAFMNLDEGDELIAPTVITSDSSAIACLSEKGRLLVFGLNECKHLASGGKGVILMDLEKHEKLLAVQAISQKGVTVRGIGRASKTQEVSLSATNLIPHISKRARKGRNLESKLKPISLRKN
jgi:topoisomerase-4 subunit A